MVERLTMYQ